MTPAKSPRTPLTADDWSAAALAALERNGLAAVAVEPIAKTLGATKGSFYWHFTGRDDLIAAALELWERRDTDGVIAAVDRAAEGADRLRAAAAARAQGGRRDARSGLDRARAAAARRPSDGRSRAGPRHRATHVDARVAVRRAGPVRRRRRATARCWRTRPTSGTPSSRTRRPTGCPRARPSRRTSTASCRLWRRSRTQPVFCAHTGPAPTPEELAPDRLRAGLPAIASTRACSRWAASPTRLRSQGRGPQLSVPGQPAEERRSGGRRGRGCCRGAARPST